MAGWDAHVNFVKTSAGDDYVEAMIFTGEGAICAAPDAKFLAGLTPADLAQKVKEHDGKTPASFIITYDGAKIKFMCTVQTPEFSFYAHSGTVGTIAKPVLVLGRTKTLGVLAMLKKKNVGCVTSCTKNLIDAGM